MAIEIIGNLQIGHAPRKRELIDFYQAQIDLNKVFFNKIFSDLFQYSLIGVKYECSKEEFWEDIKEFISQPIETLTIDLVITHGKFASVNGYWTLKNHSKIHYCDVFTYTSAGKKGKIKEIKSYYIH